MTGTAAALPRSPQFAPHPLQPFLRRIWPWLAAISSGVLLTLSFPPFDQGWLIWFALAPLICAVWFSEGSRRSRWRPAWLGYVTGIVYFTGVFHWLSNLGTLFRNPILFGLPLLLSLVLGLYIAFWAWFISWLPTRDADAFRSSRRNLAIGVLAACAWVVQEWVRGWLFSGFGWNGLGIALYKNLPMIQIAEIAGVLGVSWLVAYCNVMAVVVVRRIIGDLGLQFLRRIRWEFSISMAVVAAVFVYGIFVLFRPPAIEHVPLRVAMIQPNIPQDEKWSREAEDQVFEKLKALTARATQAKSGVDEQKAKALFDQAKSDPGKQVYINLPSISSIHPDLVVWPESAMPRGMFADDYSYDFVLSQVRNSDFALLLGTILSDEPSGNDYNGAALISDKGQRIQLYRKMHLVPFGEYLPLRPVLGPIAGGLVPGDFTAGTTPNVMTLSSPQIRFGTLICFEDTLGDLCRRFVGNGAQLLINLTNDGWFLKSAAAEQQFHHALFRAIENRRPLLRCANTGITGSVDAFGRTERWAPPFTEAVVAREIAVPRNPGYTFYTRFGDWLAYASLAFLLLWTMVRINRKSFRPGGPSLRAGEEPASSKP